MTKEETDAEIARNAFVEKYIAELQWDESTPDHIRAHVACNLRGFWSRVEASCTELFRRYHEARKLLKRCSDAFYRDGFDDGETIDVAVSEAQEWVSQEELEDEIFPSDDALAQALKERDEAEAAADKLTSLVLGESINWPFHDAAWQRAIDKLSNRGKE